MWKRSLFCSCLEDLKAHQCNANHVSACKWQKWRVCYLKRRQKKNPKSISLRLCGEREKVRGRYVGRRGPVEKTRTTLPSSPRGRGVEKLRRRCLKKRGLCAAVHGVCRVWLVLFCGLRLVAGWRGAGEPGSGCSRPSRGHRRAC